MPALTHHLLGPIVRLHAGIHEPVVADLRPLMDRALAREGRALGLCCHPDDLGTELIARESGALVCDPPGRPVQGPLRLDPDVAWVGYANAAIRLQVEPLLRAALGRRGLLP